MTFTTEMQQMLDDVHTILGQPAAITITKVTLGDFNGVTQVRASTTTTASVTATLEPRRINPGNPGMDVRESVYRVKVSALASFVPAAGDSITDGTATYKVNRVDTECNDLEYVLYCQSKANPSS